MGLPWERMPGEGPKAFASFLRYRDMGSSRSLAALCGGKRPHGRICSWSRNYGWTERVQAYDAEIARQAADAEIGKRREMAARHADLAVKLQEKALARLEKIDPSQLEPGDVLKYLIEAAKLERISRGEPPDQIRNARTNVNVNILRVDDGELIRIIEGSGSGGASLPAPGEDVP